MQKLNLFEPFDGERGEAVIEASVDVEMDEDGDLNCDTDVERKILEELEVGNDGERGEAITEVPVDVDVEMDEDGDVNCDPDVESKILEELEVGNNGKRHIGDIDGYNGNMQAQEQFPRCNPQKRWMCPSTSSSISPGSGFFNANFSVPT